MHDTQETCKAKVSILDKEYTLKGSTSEEHMKNVAEFVDKSIRDLQKEMPDMNIQKVTLLAFLNLADAHFQLMNSRNITQPQDEERKMIARKTEYLISLIEENLIGQPN